MFYHENAISESTASELYENLINSSWKWGYRSHPSVVRRSIPHWTIFFGGPTEVGESCYDCEHEISGVILNVWKEIKPYLDPDDCLIRCYANSQTCGQDQRLHTDDPQDTSKTIVVYVNKSWGVDSGGETILWDKEKQLITHSVLPKFRSILGFPGNVWHGVRSVSQYSDSLRMTLMFKTRKLHK